MSGHRGDRASSADDPRAAGAPHSTELPAAGLEEADPFRRTAPNARVISRGILWKLGSQITVQIFGLGVSLGVARLLMPSQYGSASLVLALAAFAVIFSDLTLGAVLVQRQSVGQVEASSLMWFSLGLGIVLTTAFALLTPELASLVRDHALRPLLLGIAPVFAISTAGTVPTALLNRRLEFRLLELRMITATVISSACALLIALLGGGAWALVGQQLVQTALLTALAWFGARWLPSLVVSRKHLGTLAPSALYVAGSRALSTVGANLDNLLVGRYLGTPALGAYAIAYNVLLIPLTRLAGPIQEVAFPAFSSLDDRTAIGRLWLRANAALFAVLAPVMLALAVEADDFVHVVLGPRWADAGAVLRILAIGGCFQPPIRLVPSVLQACGRTRGLFALSWLTTGMLVAGFIIGLNWGIVGVASGFAVAYATAVPFGVASALRSTGISATEFSRSLGPLLAASGLMAATMVAVHMSLPLGSPARLFVTPAIGIGVFAGVLLWRAQALTADLRTLATAIRPKIDD